MAIIHFSAKVTAGTPALIVMPESYDLTGYTLTAEFSTDGSFSPATNHGTVTRASGSVTLSLTATEVNTLQNCYYRIKAVGAKTFYVYGGQLVYATSAAGVTVADANIDTSGYLINSSTLSGGATTSSSSSNYSVTIDVRAYGAKVDGVTDDTAAIVAALAACPEGGEVVFPVGTSIISSPVTLLRNKSIRGTHAPRWAYDTGAPSRIRASAAFVGDALIRIKDEEELYGSVGAAANGQYSGPNDQCGMRLSRVTLDGFNVAGGIDGIKATGLVRDVRLTEVCIRRVTGSGVHTVGYTRSNASAYYSRGWHMSQVIADTCGNMGFAFNLLNDSTLIDCVAVGCTSNGYYIAGAGEVLIVGCRSVFNKNYGFYITGSTYGNLVLSACSTDRSTKDGIYIDTTGKQPILLNGVVLRRDGGNNNGGAGLFAGLQVNGATNPIIVSAITTEVGVDDTGAGAYTPQYALRVTNSACVIVGNGVLWGRDAASVDGGGNTSLKIGSLVVLGTGSGTPTYTYPA